MPSAGLQYELTTAAMTYFSYRRGFKAGGFNGLDPLNQAQKAGNIAYGPEYVNSYEIGLKSKWWDNRLLMNIDVFRSDYQDLQVTENVFHPATNSYSAPVTNVAASRSQGVEFETQWALWREFHFGANVTYLDAYYVSYPNASPTYLQRFQGLQVQNLSGRPTDFAPKWSGSVYADYSVPLGNYIFTAQAAPFFSSGYFNSVGTDDPLTYIDSYVRLDARLTLATSDGRWAFDVIGKNLTDRTIVTSLNNPVAVNSTKEQLRNVAAQFRYHF